MEVYNKRTWLNSEQSDSTGSVVCHDGICTHNDIKYPNRFIEVADCKNKIRLHQTTDETKEDFINKLDLLRRDICLFIYHLENKQDE